VHPGAFSHRTFDTSIYTVQVALCVNTLAIKFILLQICSRGVGLSGPKLSGSVYTVEHRAVLDPQSIDIGAETAPPWRAPAYKLQLYIVDGFLTVKASAIMICDEMAPQVNSHTMTLQPYFFNAARLFIC